MGMAAIRIDRGDYAGAVKLFERGLTIVRESGDRAGLALHFLKSIHRESSPSFGDYNPYLAGSSYSRGEKEYGENMEDRWEEYAAAVGSDV